MKYRNRRTFELITDAELLGGIDYCEENIKRLEINAARLTDFGKFRLNNLRKYLAQRMEEAKLRGLL